MTKRTLILSEQDRTCLLEMIDQAQNSWRTYAPHLNLFRTEVAEATIVRCIELPPDRVRIGDRVCLLHGRPSVPESLRLVMPYAPSIGQGELSVLSPLGTAVLGARCGERIRWLLDDGPRWAFVEDVTRGSAPLSADPARPRDHASPGWRSKDVADASALCSKWRARARSIQRPAVD